MKTFLEDFMAGSDRASYPRELRRTPGSIAGVRHDVMIVLDVNAAEIHLVRLRTAKHLAGQGCGSKTLRWLCRLADRHDITIALEPIANAHAMLTNQELRAWYTRHGFVARRQWLVRSPGMSAL